MDARGEVLITIMSSLAQQESESISKNVRMGIHYHMQQGKRRFVQGHLYGYRKNGSIVPEEAEIVRKIYRGFLDGYSTGMLARKLTNEGVMTPGGQKQWHASTIKTILKNEKYCGDFLMQKTFVEDFLTHKISKNTGQLPQCFVEDDHDPIVPREVSFRVQNEFQRRLALKSDPTKLRFGSTLTFSGRLFCRDLREEP